MTEGFKDPKVLKHVLSSNEYVYPDELKTLPLEYLNKLLAFDLDNILDPGRVLLPTLLELFDAFQEELDRVDAGQKVVLYKNIINKTYTIPDRAAPAHKLLRSVIQKYASVPYLTFASEKGVIRDLTHMAGAKYSDEINQLLRHSIFAVSPNLKKQTKKGKPAPTKTELEKVQLRFLAFGYFIVKVALKGLMDSPTVILKDEQGKGKNKNRDFKVWLQLKKDMDSLRETTRSESPLLGSLNEDGYLKTRWVLVR